MIPKDIEQYIEEHTSKEDVVLESLNRETHLKTYYPRMLSGHVQGKFLEMLTHMIQPNRILEIGTFTGYSALAMANGMKDTAILYTLEVNDEMKDFIESYIQQSPRKDQIKLLMGNALDIIPALNESFDMVFIDADKEQYIDYYEMAMDKLNQGGFIIADNVLWDGKVLQERNASDKETRALQDFNTHVSRDARVEQLIVSVRDGLLIARKL